MAVVPIKVEYDLLVSLNRNIELLLLWDYNCDGFVSIICEIKIYVVI